MSINNYTYTGGEQVRPENLTSRDMDVLSGKKKSNELKACAGGILAGSALSLGYTPINQLVVDKMVKCAKPSDVEKLTAAATQAVQKAGTNVKIIDLAKDKSLEKIFEQYLKNPIAKFFTQQNPLYQAAKGKNAAFAPGPNQIYINLEKMGNSVFHEIGHSMNFKTSKLLKAIQIARTPLMQLMSLFMLIAVCKKPKKEGEKPQGFFDKITTFIKNNVGKLSMLTMLPIFAEEMIATSKGNKLAKQLLDPQNYKQVLKANKYGALSYGLTVVAAGVTAWAANKIADKLRA